MHDVCAIAYLTSPELFETTETFIEVALEGPLRELLLRI